MSGKRHFYFNGYAIKKKIVNSGECPNIIRQTQRYPLKVAFGVQFGPKILLGLTSLKMISVNASQRYCDMIEEPQLHAVGWKHSITNCILPELQWNYYETPLYNN